MKSTKMRNGSVPLMMSLVLVVLISSAAISILQLEVARVRNDRAISTVKQLRAAIEEVKRHGRTRDKTIRLPLDPLASHWIEVETKLSGTSVLLKATEFRDGKQIFTVQDEVRQDTNEQL